MSLWTQFKEWSATNNRPINTSSGNNIPERPSAAANYLNTVKNSDIILPANASTTPSGLAASTMTTVNPSNTYDARTMGEDLQIPKYTDVITLLDRHVYQPTYQAASFAALMANPDTAKNADNFVEQIKLAWQGRKDISLGQAVADSTAYYANMLPDWGALAELNKVDINIYDKQMRERVYARMYNEAGERIDSAGNKIADASWVEKAWRGMSGTVDLTKQLVLDPFVIVGKAAKLGRLSLLDNFKSASIVENAEDFTKAQQKYAATTKFVNEEKLRLINEEPELERVTTFLNNAEAGLYTPTQIANEVDNMRVAEGFDPLPDGTDTTTYLDEYKKYRDDLSQSITDRKAMIADLNNIKAPKPQLASGVSEFVNQIVTRQMTWDEIAQHRTLREFSTDTEFLSKALELAARRGEAAVTDVLLLAQGADPSALLRLQGQHNDLLTIIDNAQTKIDDLEVQIRVAMDSADPAVIQQLNYQKKKFVDYVNALKKDDQYLSLLTRTEDSIIGSLPGTPFSRDLTVFGKEIKVSPIIEKFRADRAIVKAGLVSGSIKLRKGKVPANQQFNWMRVQKSPLHAPTYVAQWVGHKIGLEKPSGLVTISGLDMADGVKELRTILDYTPAFDGQVALKQELMDKFVSSMDSNARGAVLDEVEKEIVRATAQKYGVLDTVKTLDDGTQKPMWEVIYEDYIKRRAVAIENFRREKVFAVDTNNTLIVNPVLESQLAYSRPMIDADELDKFFKDYAVDKSVWDAFVMTARKSKDEWIMPTWVTIDRLWRADVLLRLGYPQRNVLSEWMVLSNYDRGLHGMFSVGKVTQSAKNFISNRYSHFQDIQARFQAGIDMAEKTGASTTAAVVKGLSPKRVKWAQYEDFARAHINRLQEEKQAIIELSETFKNNPDAIMLEDPTDTLALLDEQIRLEEQKLLEISKQLEDNVSRFGKRKTRGQEPSVWVGPYEFAGVFSGTQGKATMGLVSSGGRVAFDTSPYTSALKEMGFERTGTFRDIHPNEDAYFATLADIINNQLRGSRTANMILSGATKDDVIKHLLSKNGQAELKSVNWDYDTLRKEANKRRKAGWPEDDLTGGKRATAEQTADNYYDFVRYQIIENYLPNDAMRQIVRDKFKVDELGRGGKQVTSSELIVAARDTDLRPIHGEHLETTSVLHNPKLSNSQKLSVALNDYFIKRLFKFLGEYPEDAFVSHPFAASVYESKLSEIVKVWEANGIVPNPEDILQAQLQARKWAVKQSREYLYRVIRKNGIASAIPMLSPFFQAQYSTMRRVGKLSYRNPDQAARLVWAWNQINTNAKEDQNGNRWLTFRIPPSFYDDKGISGVMPEALRSAIKSNDRWQWNVNSFNLLLAGFRMPTAEVLPGEEETTQQKIARWATAGQSILGTGWTVQIPANALIKANPAMDQDFSDAVKERFGIEMTLPARDIIEIFASPYPSDKWYDPLMSGWNKRVASLVNGDGNNDFERTQLVLFQNRLDRQRTGEEPLLSNDPSENAELLWNQTAAEAGAFIALRLVVNLGSAFIPSYEGPMTPYIEQYRMYQTKYGVKAFDKWLEHYPDMGYIAVSRSRNLTGSSQSTDAVYLRKEHNAMIEQAIKNTGLPREDALAFVQMITNGEVGAEVLRDPWAGFWQKKEGDRITLSAEDGYDNLKVREGWAWLMKEKDLFNEALQLKGISRYSSSADEMNKMFREKVYKYAVENPEWYQQYSTTAGSKSANGFARAMLTALEDQKFRNSLPEDSHWFSLEKILKERELMIEAARQRGLSSPNKEMQQLYGQRIEIYLQNPTARYYFDKFLDNDPFDEAQPGS